MQPDDAVMQHFTKKSLVTVLVTIFPPWDGWIDSGCLGEFSSDAVGACCCISSS